MRTGNEERHECPTGRACAASGAQSQRTHGRQPERRYSLLRPASVCGLSARHFARAFRQSTGLSPHRWLMQLRIERARELLAARDFSLTEIALACGFADQSHFRRVFTATTGMSPACLEPHQRRVGCSDQKREPDGPKRYVTPKVKPRGFRVWFSLVMLL